MFHHICAPPVNRLFIEATDHLLTFQLCIGIQDLLDNANIADPAQIEAYQMYRCVISSLGFRIHQTC